MITVLRGTNLLVRAVSRVLLLGGCVWWEGGVPSCAEWLRRGGGHELKTRPVPRIPC